MRDFFMSKSACFGWLLMNVLVSCMIFALGSESSNICTRWEYFFLIPPCTFILFGLFETIDQEFPNDENY